MAGFSLRGAMAGLGGAMEQSGAAMLQSSLDEQRQKRLMEVQAQYQREAQERGFEHAETMERDIRQPFQRGEREAGQTFQQGQQERALTHAETMLGRQQEFQRGENAADRELRERLAKMQESGANARHGASMAIQRAQLDATINKVTLVPQTDGTYLRMRADGSSMGLLVDPLTERPIQGPKDVSASAKLLVDGNNKIIEGLEKAASTALDEKAATQLRARAEQIRQENKRLLGYAEQGTGGPEPSQSDIDLLKRSASNARAKALFEQKYGAGSAARYLDQPKEKDDNSLAHTQYPLESEGIISRGMRGLSDWMEQRGTR